MTKIDDGEFNRLLARWTRLGRHGLDHEAHRGEPGQFQQLSSRDSPGGLKVAARRPGQGEPEGAQRRPATYLRPE